MPSKFSDAERAVGSAGAAQRKKMPAGWFLDQKRRKYPTHDAGGKLSKSLLEHAEQRANQNNHSEIAARARKLLNEHFASVDPAKTGNGKGKGSKPAAKAPPARSRWI
jgi:hypothetical protein